MYFTYSWVRVWWCASGFFPSLKRLLGTPAYFLLLCGSILKFNSFIGLFTFKAKYMEQQFGQSASRANFLIGKDLSQIALPIKTYINNSDADAQWCCYTFSCRGPSVPISPRLSPCTEISQKTKSWERSWPNTENSWNLILLATKIHLVPHCHTEQRFCRFVALFLIKYTSTT